MFLSIPASIALVVGSEYITSALFGYGAFNELAVQNSAKALYFFSLGLPAFSLIKIFSSFFFANHNTKTPFYISLLSVAINIVISVYYFKEIGFIIIPIATSISSWINGILLFIFLKKDNLFSFNKEFNFRLIKIIFTSVLMGTLFNFLLIYFKDYLVFEQNMKSFYLILSVVIGLLFYVLISYWIKAFKIRDFKLNY